MLEIILPSLVMFYLSINKVSSWSFDYFCGKCATTIVALIYSIFYFTDPITIIATTVLNPLLFILFEKVNDNYL